MRYEIPEENVESLRKVINRAKNKGADIEYSEGTPFMAQVGMEGPEGFKSPVFHRFVPVTVEGKYEINGWRFVGVIEHRDGGNVIRCADREIEPLIPERYYSAPAECEHCHTSRNRNDTYLIMKDDTKEFKQVGKTCLRDFTGGMDANECAAIAECMSDAERKSVLGKPDDGFGPQRRGKTYVEGDAARRAAFALVSKYGYCKESAGGDQLPTAIAMGDMLIHGDGPIKGKIGYEAETADVTKWLEGQNCSFGYMSNAKAAWFSEYVEPRDFALIASLVSVYLRSKAETARANKSEFVGNVGDRVTVEVASVRVIATYDNTRFSRNAMSSSKFLIVGKDGNTYVWTTSSDNLSDLSEPNASVTATVKDHDEFRGTKQTVLTRGKVTW